MSRDRISSQPPRAAIRFLNWFCRPEIVQEVEGDLIEQFEARTTTNGSAAAKWLFWINTILFFRPYAIRPDLLKKRDAMHLYMWPNFLKSTVRHMDRHKGYSTISIAGLAVGFACAFVLLLFVQDERSYDRFHDNLERLYRVDTELTMPDGSIGMYSAVSWPVGRKIRTNYTGVEQVVHMRHHAQEVFHGGLTSYERIFYAEDGFFDLFSFPFLRGDRATALAEPYSVVITREMEEKYFPGSSALNQLVVLRDSSSYRVTGVLDHIPRQSHIQFDMLVSYSTWISKNPDALADTHWLDLNMFNYVMLEPAAQASHVESDIKNLLHENIGEYLDGVGYQVVLHLQPVSGIYLKSPQGNPFGKSSDIDYLYLLGAIGIFVLLIAAVNFINLGTARSVERAREVGLRKVVGSPRSLLIQQFIGEAVLTCLVAVVIAFILAALAIPHFNSLAVKELAVSDLASMPFIGGAFSIGIAIGLLAGLYPAVVLAGLRPSAILKGNYSKSRGGVFTRRSLVVFQFAISGVLIVATLVVFRQLDFMKSADVGFDREQVLVVDARKVGLEALGQKASVIKSELAQIPGVTHASVTWTVPGRTGWRSIMVMPEGKSDDEGLLTEFIAVDHDFSEVVGLEVIAGRDFDPAVATDAVDGLMVNEAAVKEMGWGTPAEAIGKTIKAPNRVVSGTVVGVVRDYNQRGLQETIRSIVFGVRPYYQYVAIRTEGNSAANVVEQLGGIWAEVFPGITYEQFFLDADFDNQYLEETRLGSVFTSFAFLAIMISCLGLLGLAAFSTAQRSKEIGIRKVNGASVANIVRLLSREFVLLVLIALIVAIPVSFRLLSAWLDSFAYRISIGFEVFVVTGLLMLGIAVLTVIFQSVRAAVSNPVEVLRYE